MTSFSVPACSSRLPFSGSQPMRSSQMLTRRSLQCDCCKDAAYWVGATEPKATGAIMHPADHGGLEGSYRPGLASRAVATGSSLTAMGCTRAGGYYPATRRGRR